MMDELADKGEPIREDARARRLKMLLGPNTELTVRGAPDSPVGHVDQYYQETLVAPFFLREAVQAEKEGFDAVIQTCHIGPGVPAAREACNIPVISALESVTHVAAMLGRKFSIVIAGHHPMGIPRYHDLIAEYGLTSKLASIRSINLLAPAFNEEKMSSEELKKLKAMMLRAARKAIDEDGADVIVTYGGPRILEHLQANLEVPVLQSGLVAPLIAEMFVKLGIAQSKRSYPKPRHLAVYGAPGVLELELPERRRKPAERRIVGEPIEVTQKAR